jgi:hypothetical protein
MKRRDVTDSVFIQRTSLDAKHGSTKRVGALAPREPRALLESK